jgi:hypothetical protein
MHTTSDDAMQCSATQCRVTRCSAMISVLLVCVPYLCLSLPVCLWSYSNSVSMQATANTNEVLEQAASFKGRLKKEMTDAMAKVQYAHLCVEQPMRRQAPSAVSQFRTQRTRSAHAAQTHTPRAHHTRILHTHANGNNRKQSICRL